MDNAEFFLGTVTAVSSADGIQIQLDGQDEAMSKYYKMMITGADWPTVGSRVVVMKHSGTYVVMGKIGTPSQNAGKVNRGGDTMTGDLTVRDAYLNMDNPDVTVGTRPSTKQWSKPFRIRDSAGKSLARIIGFYGSNGKCGIQIYGDQIVNGESKYNYLGLYMDDSGVASVEMNNPGAWRSALNALNKSGDTMTGALTMNGGDINLRSTENTIGTVPATSTSDKRVYFRDKLNAIFGKLQSIFLNDGRIGMQLGAQRSVNGSTVENNLSMYIDASGNRTVTFTSPQVWRSALGIGSRGAFPITVAQGGTGNTGVVSETTIANVIDVASGFTISFARYHVWGKLAMFYIGATATAAVTTNQWTVVGTLKSGKRPKDTQRINAMSNRETAIVSSGALQVWGTFQSGQEFEFSAAYLLA